jgi:hypothetical protein
MSNDLSNDIWSYTPSLPQERPCAVLSSLKLVVRLKVSLQDLTRIGVGLDSYVQDPMTH